MKNNEPLPGAQELKSYWKVTKGKSDIFEALTICNAEFGLSAEDLENYPKTINLDQRYTPDKRTIGRLLNDETNLRDPCHALGLLLIAYDALTRSSNLSEVGRNVLSRLSSHLTTLRNMLGERFPAALLFSEGPAQQPVPVADILGLMQRYLKASADSFEKMDREFFPNLNLAKLGLKSQEKYFNMYRFHSKPNKVVKSFIVVKSPVITRPFSMFTNFFVANDPESPRRSDGVLLPTNDFLYFIGGLDAGTGLKLIAIERKPHGRHGIYHGLTISFDENETLVAARCFMLPTQAKNHKEAGARIYSMGDLDIDARQHLDEIENRIPIELTGAFTLDGNPIPHRTIVQVLSDLGGAAQPRFLRDGKEYNPVDQDNYTFNAALKGWDHR